MHRSFPSKTSRLLLLLCLLSGILLQLVDRLLRVRLVTTVGFDLDTQTDALAKEGPDKTKTPSARTVSQNEA